MLDPSLTWRDLEQLAEAAPVPVLVKGVLTPEDARRALDNGAAGIVVSNHGGRQLDTVLSGADALPEVVDAVGGDIDVLVDGGIRRGTDVLKALALGARAVLVGRAVVWGLAVGGEQGVRDVLELRERGAADARVYRVHNKLGEPCYVCGAPIARVDFEEHTIYYCPDCQTGGRVLKDRRLSKLLR